MHFFYVIFRSKKRNPLDWIYYFEIVVRQVNIEQILLSETTVFKISFHHWSYIASKSSNGIMNQNLCLFYLSQKKGKFELWEEKKADAYCAFASMYLERYKRKQICFFCWITCCDGLVVVLGYHILADTAQWLYVYIGCKRLCLCVHLSVIKFWGFAR